MTLGLTNRVPLQYSRDEMQRVVDSLTARINSVSGGAIEGRLSRTAAPTTGTWGAGQVVWNSAPSSSAIGWVCTASGTPGTWLAFGGGSSALLDTKTAAVSATLDFTSSISSSYSRYEFHFRDMLPATDDVGFWMRISHDGSTWEADAADYTWGAAGTQGGGSSYNASNSGDTEIELIPSGIGAGRKVGNAEGFSGVATLWIPSDTSATKKAMGLCTWRDPSGRQGVVQVGGTYIGSTAAITGVRFLASSGDLTSGSVQMYGIT